MVDLREAMAQVRAYGKEQLDEARYGSFDGAMDDLTNAIYEVTDELLHELEREMSGDRKQLMRASQAIDKEIPAFVGKIRKIAANAMTGK